MSDEVTRWIIAAAAVLAACGYLVSKARAGARKLDKLDELLSVMDELLSAVHKDVPAMARAVGKLQATVNEMRAERESDRQKLRRLILIGARHHPEAADEYLEQDR